MASASSPHDDPAEALFGEGRQRRHNERVVQIDGDVDVARPVVSVLWCGPEGNSRECKRLNAKVSAGLFGRSIAHLIHEPGVEVYREVRSLLLGASCGDDGKRAMGGLVADFFVCVVAVFHV